MTRALQIAEWQLMRAAFDGADAEIAVFFADFSRVPIGL
jgi:hypothetical protein